MRHYISLASLLCVTAVIAAPAAAQGWKVGDAVQYFDSGWWPATVIEIGTGEHTGSFKVKADNFSTMQWAQGKNVRARPGAPPAIPAAGPRLGDYGILSYGTPGRPPIRLGKITLSAGGAYRFYDNGDNQLGSGTYSYAANTVTWLTGLLKTQGWGGAFEVTREGKTHNIKLKSGTTASNSN